MGVGCLDSGGPLTPGKDDENLTGKYLMMIFALVTKLTRTHIQILGEPQVSKILRAEIPYKSGLFNCRSGEGNKEEGDAEEHAGGVPTRGEPGAWAAEVSFLGSVDLLPLAMLRGKVP